MQAVHLQNPMPQPSRIHPSRIWRVTVAVMFGHLVVAWLVSSGVLTSVVPASEPDNVIMASVVMDAPAPRTTTAPKPTPARPPIQIRPPTKPEPQPQPQAKPVSPQVQPAPVLSPTAPSNAAPIVSNAAPALTPAAPATPTATPAGNQRPAANATATDVVLPSTSADYLNNPAPPYPRQSKRLGEEGTVVIRVLITAEGRAEKAEIRTSSGHARLDDTALTTVKAWRFVPGKRNGLPEAMWFNVPIRFVLD
jgi:periplasmic protein TonB